MFGVRNPAHEIQLRELVMELSSRPVTCGHELASDLDAPRRALTVALNARMVPIIHELIDAVEAILQAKKIDAPLMMVKGDGSLVNTATALKQPVGTVLSGPAASVVGACALSGAEHAIIADMGGTTTDIAVVTDGIPELATDGVRIGGWKPMVEAVRVISIGLGGDSEVCFSGVTGVEVGPRRVVPLSLAARQFSNVIGAMKRQLAAAPDRRDNLFAMRLERNDVLLSTCSNDEMKAWELLGDRAVELKAITDTDRDMARAIARLQRKGLAIYSGFTPSDAAHVLGYSSHWDTEAAEIAALLWARQMRHVYGLGDWGRGDAVSPSRHVFACVNQRISQALIEAGLLHHRILDQAEADNLTQLLAELVYESVDAPQQAQDSRSLFQLNFAADYPIVAVGAPAATFFPAAALQLGADLSLPRHGEVANAYGAVMGSVLQRAHVTVTQPQHGQFVVHSDREPIHLTKLDDAISTAENLARERVRGLALAAGAAEVVLRLSKQEKHVGHDVDDELFLEAKITATATGRPGYTS
jgi:N-methylhydantoinase A/oxoprolinase/acetone carboxylase beta subunit